MSADPSPENNLTDNDIDSFVAFVGEKIRDLRASNGLSRKELAVRSAVSERYLAQLESGSGNITIAILYKVARALGQEPAALLKVSSTAAPAENLDKICLIGLRGAGKSTLGKSLAEKSNKPFLELNEKISKDAGIPLEEVIALYGQEGFRRLEFQALNEIAAIDEPFVLAVGGGIVTDTKSFEYLLANFFVIWLQALPEEHMQRVLEQGDNRPMAGNANAMKDLRTILSKREQEYSRAHATINTSGKSVSEALEALQAMSAIQT